MILTKRYDAPPVCEREVLRYAGCKEADGESSALLTACQNEVAGKLSYQICYRELPVTVGDESCDLGGIWLPSRQLAGNLRGCRSVILFAATIGVEIDRLIAKYGRISPAKALLLQAIGAERIEALCDAFCADIAREKQTTLRPRFSPGYGDLSLTAQKDIFALLDCEKRIGLCLTDRLLMSPSKSVTAIVGLGGGETRPTNKCSLCGKTDCTFRGAL